MSSLTTGGSSGSPSHSSAIGGRTNPRSGSKSSDQEIKDEKPQSFSFKQKVWSIDFVSDSAPGR